MPPEELKSGMKRIDKKMTTSTTIEFGKHPYEEGLKEVLGNSATKIISLLWTYGKHLQNYEVITGHKRE